MKKSLFLLVIILVVAGWTANKYIQRASKSSDEKSRFMEKAGNYNDNTKLFLIEQLKKHHDEAFAASYRMWVLSPISELDLSSHYDEQTYYRTLGKAIAGEAKKAGQGDAYNAILDMAQHYGVETKAKKAASKPTAQSGSSQKKNKFGETRKIPSSRSRDHDR